MNGCQTTQFKAQTTLFKDIMDTHISKYLSVNNTLLDTQHGFHEKLLTVQQSVLSFDDCSTTIQSRGQVDVVFVEFIKAFDVVPNYCLCKIVTSQTFTVMQSHTGASG